MLYTEKEINKRLDLTKALVVKAGQAILRLQGTDLPVEQKEGGVGDIVTLADHISQEIIISGVKEKFPEDIIDSEEQVTEEAHKVNSWKWIWDPLDATVQYKTRAREWGVSGGVHFNGEPVAGAIYFPRFRFLYWTKKNEGAFMHERDGYLRKLHTSKDSDLIEGTFGYNYPYFKDEKTVDQFISPVFKKFPGRTMYIHVPVCVTLALCNLAEGIGPLAMINGNVTPHDLGAAAIIVKEAGGIISPIDWNKKRQPILAAANQEIYNETINLLGPDLLQNLGFHNSMS